MIRWHWLTLLILVLSCSGSPAAAATNPVTGAMEGVQERFNQALDSVANLPDRVVDAARGAIQETLQESLEGILRQEIAAATRGTIDDWAVDSVDMPVRSFRGLYGTVFLTMPSLLDPGQGWALTGYAAVLLLSLIPLTAAWLNHMRHLAKGTDQHLRRSLWTRLGVPGLALAVALLLPWLWEVGYSLQAWLWSAPPSTPASADRVLAPVLPGGALGDPGGMVPAGYSVEPLAAQVGTPLGVGTGLVLLLLGLLALAGYLVGKFLLIAGPFYLAITAFSNRYEPLWGYLDVSIRTCLLVSLFNGTWQLMQNAPRWMAWTGVDAVAFVLLILPLLLLVLWRFWMSRVIAAIADPLRLGAGQTVEAVGNLAGKAGTLAGVVSLAVPQARPVALALRGASEGARNTGQALKAPAAPENWARRLQERAEQALRSEASSPEASRIPGGIAPTGARPVELVRQFATYDEMGQPWEAFHLPRAAVGPVANHLSRHKVGVEMQEGALRVLPSQAARARQVIDGYLKDRSPYWSEGNRYVVIVAGTETYLPAPPPRGIYMGERRREGR